MQLNIRGFLMRKKWLLYTGFFVLLFAGFYVALTKMIPGYGTVQLPVLSNVQPFSFTNQEGKIITQKELAGKVYIAEYFFTTCRGICPKMNNNLREVYQHLEKEPNFLILSHTVNPGTDSVPVLKRYADSLGITGNNWWFVTGRKDSLYQAARVSYLLDDPKNNSVNPDEQFIHTQFFALVDKNGRVRKIVDGLRKEELQEMENDIHALLKEPESNGRFANSLFNNNPN